MFTTTHKTIIVSVINDLATDQRVLRSAEVLTEAGFDVILFGRELQNSPSVNHLPYKTKRIKMLFTKGPLFYLFYNWRLFWFLLTNKSDVLFSNDLDTLLPNYLVSKFRKTPLIYDSHEIFCEVPELQNTLLKKKIWSALEKKIVPKLKNCITVNDSIAAYFKNKYNTPFNVVRNIPTAFNALKLKSKQELGIPENKTILILQGAGINIQRGAEEMVEAMKYVNNAHLYIIGGGDVFDNLKKLVTEFNLTEKVTIKTKMPKSELMNFTRNSDIGISIDKDTNLNYHFSLPNKLFDYIQSNIPILASRLPEIENLIKHYNIGCFIDNHEPKHIAEKINFMRDSGLMNEWKTNTGKANAENNWETEKKKLINIINALN